MSTSSKYSSNKLKQVISNNTQHFIAKSYITTIFEYERKVAEYHLYWINKNKGVFEDMPRYQCMSFKLMNRKEIAFFQSILNEYNVEIENQHGKIWENKKLGFNKTLVRINQLSLF